MRQIAVLFAVLALAGCATMPVVTCPDLNTTESVEAVPNCDMNLEGCLMFDGNEVSQCLGGEWLPIG